MDSDLPLLIMGLRVQQEGRKATGDTMARRKGDAWEKICKSQKQPEWNEMHRGSKEEFLIINCAHGLPSVKCVIANETDFHLQDSCHS